MILTMSALAEKYSISKLLIRKTIAMNDDFPYTREAHLFRFDTEKVEEWLLTHDWARGEVQYNPHIHERLEREAIEKKHKRQLAGLDPDEKVDSISKLKDTMQKRNAKAEVQTALLQLELDKKRGRLVDRDDVVNEFAPIIATLAKGLEIMPNLIGKRHGLTDACIRDIRDHIDQLREGLVRSAKNGILSDDFVMQEHDDK